MTVGMQESTIPTANGCGACQSRMASAVSASIPQYPTSGFYAGNLLTCDRKDVFLILLDLTNDGVFFAAHNPSDEPLDCTISPAPGFAKIREIPGFAHKLTIPAGTTQAVTVDFTANKVK